MLKKHRFWQQETLAFRNLISPELRFQKSYEYDEVGNRVKMTADKEVTEYRYNEADQLMAAGDTEYEYDDNGNLITQYTPDETTDYYYDSAGRLSDVKFEDQTSLSYGYDGFGRKVSRSEEYWHPEDTENKLRTEKTNYLFDGDKVLKEYTGEGGPLAEYYTANDQIIARKMFGFHDRKEPGRYGNLQTKGGLMYYQYDALGNVTDLTDHLGDNIAKYRFDAFGGMFAGVLAPYSSQGITGKEYDPKSGLMFYNSRWYDPGVGRFTQADTFKGFATKPASQHPYAYVGNNPINNIDPTGHTDLIIDGVDVGDVYLNDEDDHTYFGDGVGVRDYYEGQGYTVDWIDGQVVVTSGSGGSGGSGGSDGGGGSSYHEPTKAERKGELNILAHPVPISAVHAGNKGNTGYKKTQGTGKIGTPIIASSVSLAPALPRTISVPRIGIPALGPLAPIATFLTTLLGNPSATGENPVEMAITRQIYLSEGAEAEKGEQRQRLIYRWGSWNNTNLTPRPKDITGLSFSTVKPQSGKYVVTTMEIVNATGILTAVQDAPGHVSVLPVNVSQMPGWIDSRPNAATNPHELTTLLKSITIPVVR